MLLADKEREREVNNRSNSLINELNSLTISLNFSFVDSLIQSAVFRFTCTVTLEFTLFTFCPPGPLLRANVNVNCSTGI